MEDKKFKIALFMLPLLTQGGGAEKYFIELARNLRERSIEADVVTMDEKFFRKFARILHIFTHGNFLEKIDVSGREKEKNVLKCLGKSHWIKVKFKELGRMLENYDIVYTKNELVDLVLLKAKGYRKLPPIVVGAHTPIFYPETKSVVSKFHNFLYVSFFYKWLLRGTKHVHVSNEFTKNILREKFNIESELIYYPFSTETIAKLAKENTPAISFDADKKNIIFAGRLGEQKGVDFLLRIIRYADKDIGFRDKICINIFGSGDKKYEAAIKNLAKKNSFVRYFGHIENKLMPAILTKHNLAIAPSKWETLPYSVLEAQAVGVPVVAFDIPGPNDIIENEKTGILAKDEEKFLEAIKNFVDGKIIFDKNYIIENIRKKFDPPKIYSELIKMFSDNLPKTKP